MTSEELIAKIKEIDPAGKREVCDFFAASITGISIDTYANDLDAPIEYVQIRFAGDGGGKLG